MLTKEVDDEILAELNETIKEVDKENQRSHAISRGFIFFSVICFGSAYRLDSEVLALIGVGALLVRICTSIDLFKANAASSKALQNTLLLQIIRNNDSSESG